MRKWSQQCLQVVFWKHVIHHGTSQRVLHPLHQRTKPEWDSVIDKEEKIENLPDEGNLVSAQFLSEEI